MTPRSRAPLAVAVALVLVAAIAVPSGAALVQVDVPTDGTAMDASVGPDGDADWTVAYRVELDTDERRAAFAALEDDVAANASAYRDRFRERMDRTVARAAEETGRTMAVENLTVGTTTAGVPAEYGVLRYRFRWTNFAATDGETVRVGDALAGLFLDADTSLTVRWPEGFATDAVSPSPTTTGETSVTWRGPRDFGPGEPRVVLAPAGGAVPVWPLAAGVAVLVAAAVVVLAWRRRTTGATATERQPSTDEEGDPAPPDELLSNEERVRKLLEQEGGRIKQQEIAGRLEWTDAKTSQVIGDLRDAGEVETFRIGRENVVTLPDHEL